MSAAIIDDLQRRLRACEKERDLLSERLSIAEAETESLRREVDELSKEIRAHSLITIAITASLNIAEIFEAIVAAVE